MVQKQGDNEMKPWGGRFSQPTDELVEEFTASINFDKLLYNEDISGSIAHAQMLASCGIISDADASAIVAGLQQIRSEIESGEFVFSEALEDIHMNIESRLGEIIGRETAGRLHTGRSRNDQVALDLRLFLKNRLGDIARQLLSLIQAFKELASANIDVVMPGFTHLQQAQPVLFAHHLLAYVEMFKRDYQRLRQTRERLDFSPLGSGALAGSSFPLDRKMVADALGFNGLTANSLDAVSDRDGVAESLFGFSLIMVHLTRFCEELVLWSTVQFNFITLSDSFCTGSSIMPQKKNPDVPELIRGKAGRVIGSLVSILYLLKSLPLAYNRDLQEDKEPLFDAANTVYSSLRIMTSLVANLAVNREIMEAQAGEGFSTATEIADYLVRKGMPFRSAHAVVGNVVAHCEKHKLKFTDLSLADWESFSPLFDFEIMKLLAPEDAVRAKNLFGGTAPEQVRRQIDLVERFLEQESRS